MAPKLFVMAITPAVRAVLLTGAALNIKFDITKLDLADKKEHLSPEYLKINPQHTVPTLIDDDGFIIWDSHAISAYLVERYGTDDSLYPRDVKKRATINQRLHFDTGVLFPLIVSILRPIAMGSQRVIPNQRMSEVYEAYGFLDKFLERHRFLAGCQVTIADFNAVASTSVLEIVFPVHPQKYPNLTGWLKRMKNLPYFEDTNNGLEMLREAMRSVRVEGPPRSRI